MKKLKDSYIKDFLENAPLYTWREFMKPDVNRGSLLISEIDAYCEFCKQDRPFQDLRARGAGSKPGVDSLSTGQSYFEFTCVSCRKVRYQFFVDHVVSEDTIKIQKHGERPRKKLDRDPLLQNFFSHDIDCYEKAIICLANGYGIAAFAYMRRIIENNITELIDLLKEDIEATESCSPILEKLAELKKESPMCDKITIANEALPSYLIPSGLNPLGRLYKILSEGVHALSDEECLKRASSVQACIKYLIGELATRKKNRESFKELVGSL